ncbi:alpha-hydroxy acid oxidase [Arthrobacter sp. ISL-69]|uniref:alpha-hydroxy acid oxidase n=1 Tax=Arthrobacter sp. ISL-69 TaxID=2819113 RepID=UPI001BEC7A39|nr:alpha-hydroxy acid oxidase [Arthrobacter sp. ISL-69]MBT2539054.1 alpha-hydroxy-acid oxidizing protein [Arthrobacter sp. ISL-69]
MSNTMQGIIEFGKMLAAPSGPRGIQAVPSNADMRLLAKRKVPKMIFDFIDGGGGDEITLRANEKDLQDVILLPRSLVDVRLQDTTATFAGDNFGLPVIMGPAGLVRVAGSGGELSAVRAAGKKGVPYVISTSSAFSIEEIAAEATGPLWFQLYLWRSKELVKNLIDRAKEAGCTALVLTVDVPLNANRIRDLRNGMSIPPKVTLRNAYEAARRPKWLKGIMTGPPIGFRNLQGIAQGSSALSHSEFINKELANLGATWEDLEWLRRQWDGPIYVKGILTAEDAIRAREAGANGVIVSNHGGRQLDGLPSSIRALPAIAEAVGRDLEIFMDGGIRTGSDVLKAKALGATAVLIARPWVFGVAAAGEAGVERVISIFEQEIQQSLALLGAARFEDIDSGFASFPQSWERNAMTPDLALNR